MIRFTRDGQHVILRDGDALGIVELEGTGRERTIEAPGLHDFAAFDDEVWVAAGNPPWLARYSLTGERRGEKIALGGPPSGDAADARGLIAPGGTLWGAPFGEPAAIWMGGQRIDLRLDKNEISAVPIEEGAAAMLPLAGGRRVELEGGQLSLRGPDGTQSLGPAGGEASEGRVGGQVRHSWDAR